MKRKLIAIKVAHTQTKQNKHYNKMEKWLLEL